MGYMGARRWGTCYSRGVDPGNQPKSGLPLIPLPLIALADSYGLGLVPSQEPALGRHIAL
jgi:hypothetical protein